MSDMLKRIQKEQPPWVAHNFGDRPAWNPLLGIVEEVGELSHAFLKREQGIRTTENHDEAIRDAVADIIIYLCDFATSQKIDLSDAVAETWSRVKLRDWIVDPQGAGIDTADEVHAKEVTE